MIIFSSNSFVFDPDVFGVDFYGEPDYWAHCKYQLGQPIEFDEVQVPALRGVSISRAFQRPKAQKTRRGRRRHGSDTTMWWSQMARESYVRMPSTGGRKPRHKK